MPKKILTPFHRPSLQEAEKRSDGLVKLSSVIVLEICIESQINVNIGTTLLCLLMENWIPMFCQIYTLVHSYLSTNVTYIKMICYERVRVLISQFNIKEIFEYFPPVFYKCFACYSVNSVTSNRDLYPFIWIYIHIMLNHPYMHSLCYDTINNSVRRFVCFITTYKIEIPIDIFITKVCSFG